ncbi:nucleotidyl transferase AbiEii/AbiGii toxin family protein [Candidatus Parcubacteria bacterium]|nr:nucleotidyl transferase AbiEii/AbiGii toxin family protein [Patescibacteria group bacterium]MBU4380687.1 nucleotidyl transferase AbiEii/AbiGii toxin family protein [Patescibacteria group bacterium]MCG2689604.1 nucleotidyl transferase AbiEii/AbiGii toxin family protein [Candidatus Parcubacteria bacterium]
MFPKALNETTRKNLALLGKSGLAKDFYLAGGSSLALNLGHRISEDLDFFSNKNFDLFQIVNSLSSLGTLTVDVQTTKTFLGNFNGTKLSFFYYELPLLKPTDDFLGISIANPVDVGCMKLDAISGRGLKKDFVDLYFITQEVIPLDGLLEMFREKVAKKNYNFIHLAKSLTYFDDAQDKVTMLKDYDWEKIKRFFLKKSQTVFS